MSKKDINLKEIYKAYNNIQTIIKNTLLLKSFDLSSKLNNEVYYKLEFLQPTGSFKIRGAGNFIKNLKK